MRESSSKEKIKKEDMTRILFGLDALE